MKSMDAEQGASPYRVWPAEPASFSTRRMSPLRHNINEHPLFQLSALQALAHELMPAGQCRFQRPGATQGSAFVHEPKHPQGLSIDEVIARMEEPGSWLALYNVQTDARYRAALERIVDDLRPMVEREQPGIFLVTGFIFISAPPSVTPFHIDRENNFWLQLHGHKIMNVWDHRDRRIVPAEAVEDFIVTHSLRKVRYREEFRAQSHEFHARPGDGVYFPSTSPHMTRSDPDWTAPGDRVSISIGVTFYTSFTRKVARVHQVNRVMRRCGLSPRYPGESPGADAFKASLGGLVGSARAKLLGLDPLARRFKLATAPPPGSY